MSVQSQIAHLQSITKKFEAAFQGLDAEKLNAKPAPDVWSIAQNIDHLIQTNASYFPVIEAVRAGTYKRHFLAKIPFIVRLFGKLILNSVKPDSKQKIKTFPVFEPSQSTLGGDILEKFVRHQTELAELIRASEDLIAAKTVIASPANEKIVYYLETAFEIMIWHEERHFLQAQALLASK